MRHASGEDDKSISAALIEVEKCPALRVAIDVYFGAGPTDKVDSNKRKEAHTQKQNGGNLMQNGTQNFIYIVLCTKTPKVKIQRNRQGECFGQRTIISTHCTRWTATYSILKQKFEATRSLLIAV